MNIGKFALSATGRVQATATTTGAKFQGGQAYVGSRAVVDAGAVAATDVSHAGFRYTSGGALRVYDATAGLPTPVNVNQGVVMTEDGQACYSSDANATVAVLNGMSLTKDGAIFMDIV